MKRFSIIILTIVAIIAAGSIVVSCGQEVTQTVTNTSTVTNTTTTEVTNTSTLTSTVTTTLSPTTTPPVTTTTPAVVTAGELASFGGTLYNKNCTYIPDCHARFEGGGGDIQLSGEAISPLDNAETVYGVISSIMHLAIGDYQEDAPTAEEYLQILAYVLIETELIQPGDLMSRETLSNILFELPSPTTTPTTTATTEPTQTTTTTTTSIVATWGELAARGVRSFDICAECHGETGGGDFGPEIIGTTLQSFGDAWRLYAYISTQMPWDGPGSLSTTTYQRILAFMLTESGFVQPEALFDENELPNILLMEDLDM
ncbi:MAG: hypothetical protein JSV74_03080 [Dehalococcoidia bacterium]|nr:MAG: hypothetical protein JSV74_03080 [Dehalococcoidia bacterium]